MMRYEISCTNVAHKTIEKSFAAAAGSDMRLFMKKKKTKDLLNARARIRH